jgi:hypothetical protein
MDYNQHYLSLIETIKSGARAWTNLDERENEGLQQTYETLLASHQFSELDKILCLLDHARTPLAGWEKILVNTLRNEQAPSDTLVYTMSVCGKHVIDYRGRQSERQDMAFLEALATLLSHKNLEVIEWSLRTLEQCGPQTMMVKEQIISKRPGLSRLFSQRKKHIQGIIDVIESYWPKI